MKNTNYVRSESSSQTRSSSHHEEADSSVWQSKFLSNVLRTIAGVIALFCFIFVMIFLREFCGFLWQKITN